MFTSRHAVAAPVALLLLSGCAVERAEPGEDVGSAAAATVTVNTVTVNTVTVNTVTVNTVTVNTLISNTLTDSGIEGRVLDALQDTTPVGVANRTIFHYIVTCALEPDQSVTYTWADDAGTYTVTEQGQIGLAPTWSDEPLRDRGQQLVSGCIAARVNYFGVTVPISVRNEVLAESTGSDELSEFPHVEGAFWGNLFVPNPRLYACYDPRNVANSRADQRECASGYPEGNGHVVPCGPITLTVPCDPELLDPWGQFYWACGDDYSLNAITVGLQTSP
jgi:hypothetical protein